MTVSRTVRADDLKPGMRVYDRDSGLILNVDRITPVPNIENSVIVFTVYELTHPNNDRTYELLGDHE